MLASGAIVGKQRKAGKTMTVTVPDVQLRFGDKDNAGRIVLGGGRAGGNLAGKNFVEPTVIVDADPEHEPQ